MEGDHTTHNHYTGMDRNEMTELMKEIVRTEMKQWKKQMVSIYSLLKTCERCLFHR